MANDERRDGDGDEDDDEMNGRRRRRRDERPAATTASGIATYVYVCEWLTGDRASNGWIDDERATLATLF